MGAVVTAEWHRGLQSWRTWVAVAATIGVLLFTAIQYVEPWYPPDPTPRSINFFSVSVMALGGFLTALWPVLIPVLAALPAGDSLALDRRRGLDALVISRVGWSRYLWGKLVGTLATTLFAVGVGLAAVETLFAVRFPLALPHLLGWHYTRKIQNLPYHVKLGGVIGDSYLTQFHPHFFWAQPAVYVALVVLVALLATTALAALSTAAAVWMRQPLLTIAVPIILFLVGDVVTQALFQGRLVPSVYAGAYVWYLPPPASFLALAIYWAALAAVPVAIMGWMVARRKEWPRSV